MHISPKIGQILIALLPLVGTETLKQTKTMKYFMFYFYLRTAEFTSSWVNSYPGDETSHRKKIAFGVLVGKKLASIFSLLSPDSLCLPARSTAVL